MPAVMTGMGRRPKFKKPLSLFAAGFISAFNGEAAKNKGVAWPVNRLGRALFRLRPTEPHNGSPPIRVAIPDANSLLRLLALGEWGYDNPTTLFCCLPIIMLATVASVQSRLWRRAARG